MAEEFDDVDYEDSWFDSYEKWQENAEAASDKYQSEVAEFISSAGVDTSPSDVTVSDFLSEVQGFSESDWQNASRDKQEWMARYIAGRRDDTSLSEARSQLGLS